MRKKLMLIIFLITVIVCSLLTLSNYIIKKTAEKKTFNAVTNIPKNKVGIVLGTARKLRNGKANPYYTYRINATTLLYKAKKIDYILVSGDNSSKYYNEPTHFKKDLIKNGIPANKIVLDYAGFRTLDSMVRAKVVFGLDSVTVISQKFHNERAIYLAEKNELHAIGFNAKDISGKQGLKVQIREYFARVKVFIDLLTNKEPKFYGEKIKVG